MPSIFRILGRALFRGDATGSGNAVEIADSSGTNRLVVANTGRVTVSQDTTVATETCAVITTDTANANLVLAPNGTGAIIADIPDGAASGGNARGDNAVDLQTVRTSNNQVARGSKTVISGGESNDAEGAGSSIGGGRFNWCNSSYSSISGGEFATTRMYGQRANASGAFTAYAGDAQTSSITFRRSITGTAINELFLDGSSARAVLALAFGATAARAWRAQIDVVAICATAGGGTTVLNDCFMGSYLVGIKNAAGTTALVGTVNTLNEVSDTSMSTSLVTITADNTNDSLKIEFTPPTTADGTTVIRVVATAYLTEVGR